ncbi:MAG: hypothetical protein Q9184_001998 [Pyrenodesmia sp. 2 TL-2023]
MAPETSNLPADDLDDLFDYDVNMQDVFRDAKITMDVPIREHTAHTNSRDKDLGLGLDEEIKVTKKRQPVPKLDDNRLLSQAGIPKLRRLAKERLQFKGKGYEYSDLAALLNLYQFWLDDLYPRAKFADGLAMIEKLGHSKRIQVMRREWINEGKPRERYEDMDVSQGNRRVTKASDVENTVLATNQDHALDDSQLRPSSDPTNEDLYGASPPRQQHNTNQNSATKTTGVDQAPLGHGDSEIPEDDLDVLLAELAPDNHKNYTPESAPSKRQETTSAKKFDDFDAEMEAIAEMDDVW